MVKCRIYSHQKDISSNHPFSDFFSTGKMLFSRKSVISAAQCRKTRNSLSLKFFTWNQFFSNFFSQTLLSRNFCQKYVRVNFHNSHSVENEAYDILIPTEWKSKYWNCNHTQKISWNKNDIWNAILIFTEKWNFFVKSTFLLKKLMKTKEFISHFFCVIAFLVLFS